SPDGHLVEFVEYPREQHPFFVATQAHPEYKSRPTRPHPLFVAFIKAALDYENEMRLPVEPWRSGQGADTGAETVDAPDAKTSTVRVDEVDPGTASDARTDGN